MSENGHLVIARGLNTLRSNNELGTENLCAGLECANKPSGSIFISLDLYKEYNQRIRYTNVKVHLCEACLKRATAVEKNTYSMGAHCDGNV